MIDINIFLNNPTISVTKTSHNGVYWIELYPNNQLRGVVFFCTKDQQDILYKAFKQALELTNDN